MQKIIQIVVKEFKLEWRQKNALFGILLYLLCIVFLIYLMQDDPDSLVWNSLIWLSILFITINTVAKSFMAESKGRWLYYYTIYHPKHLILAKLIYNAILMLVVAVFNFLLFYFFLGFPAINKPVFVGLFLLGSISFGMLFTLLSSIVSKSGNNTTMLAIIGFPLVFPLLMLVDSLSVSLFESVLVQGWNQFFIALVFMDIMLVALSIILYPFIWKD